MDSAWYAVDETGEVARFDTGEAGGFPENAQAVDGEAATAHDDPYTVFYLQAASLARALDDRELSEFNEWSELSAKGSEKFHVLAAFPPGADVARFGLSPLWENRHCWAVTTAAWSAGQLNELAGHAEAVFGEGGDTFFDDELPGITRFECQDYDEPGRYMLMNEAEDPLTAEQLPEAIRAKVLTMKLPVQFGTDESIQLADLPGIGNVATWGDVPLKAPTAEEAAALEAQRVTRVAEQARKTRMALIGVGIFTLLCIALAIFWPGGQR